MSNLKHASLVLRTSDLSLNIANAPNGSINSSRTIMTWTNMNLRTLLGDMYDTCDTFNLDLVQIFSHQAAYIIGATIEDKAFIIQISGLPFINQTYSVRNSCNTNTANLCFYSTAGSFQSPLINSYNGRNILTFGKNQDFFDITLSFVRVNGIPIDTGLINTGINAGQPIPMPFMVFLFNIYGVTKEETYKNDRRLF